MNNNDNENAPPGKKIQPNFLSKAFNNSLVVTAILLVVSFLVFIPSLSNEFVWDDISYIQNNIDHLKSSKINVKRLFYPKLSLEEAREKKSERKEQRRKLRQERRTNSASRNNPNKKRAKEVRLLRKSQKQKQKNNGGRKYFRPIHETSLIIDAKLWGDNSLGFHLTNIILHSISTILLYFLFLLVLKEFGVTNSRPAAFLSAMLFALYPLHVESVSFIAARGDMLASIFFSLAFILYIFSYRRFFYIVPAAVSLYLSFLSKEVAISFPIVLVGFDLISGKIKSLRNLIKYVILGLAFIFYLYLRSIRHMNFLQMLGGRESMGTDAGANIVEIVKVFFGSYLFYLKKLIFPFDLNPFIGTISGGDVLHTIIAIIVIAALIAVFVVSIRKKENITALCLLWIFATLGPAVMTAVFPLAITRYAERFLYVPSAGMCLLLGYLIIKAGEKFRRQQVAYLFGSGLCVIFLVFTLNGQRVWNNSLSLWEYAVNKSPNEIVPKLQYAVSLVKAQRSDEAVAQYLEALKPQTYGNNKIKARAAAELGDLYLTRGDFDSASKYYKASVSLSSTYEEDYNYKMGLISAKKNDPISAEKYLLRSIELNPGNRNAYYVLGSIYLVRAGAENNPELYIAARDNLEIASGFKRSVPEANLKLAVVYIQLGDIESAKVQAQIAIDKGIEAKGLNEARAILNMN